MPAFLLIDDSANELYFVFWFGYSRESDGNGRRGGVRGRWGESE